MSELRVCPACERHVDVEDDCPFCAEASPPTKRRSRWTTAAFSAGASMAALSLQACYGAPPPDHRMEAQEQEQQASEEEDANTAPVDSKQ